MIVKLNSYPNPGVKLLLNSYPNPGVKLAVFEEAIEKTIQGLVTPCHAFLCECIILIKRAPR